TQVQPGGATEAADHFWIVVLVQLKRVRVEYVQVHSASGSSSTFRRYASMDRFQSSIHGSSLNMPANSAQGSGCRPSSRARTSVPFLSRAWIFARSFANASSR